MPRLGIVANADPYHIIGTFAGMPFWEGGLTLLSAFPGAGKTSWLLRMVFEAAAAGMPSAIACYEHTDAEMMFRMRRQAEGWVFGAHEEVDDPGSVERYVAKGATSALIPVDYSEHTVRAIEDLLLKDYSFPEHGPALVAVDYLNLIPVVGATGLVPVEFRSGEAAAMLRKVARKRGWAVIAAAALKSTAFTKAAPDLNDLFGDERVPYEADRVFIMNREGTPRECGCTRLNVYALKDRTDMVRTIPMDFWGARFFTATQGEFQYHDNGR